MGRVQDAAKSPTVPPIAKNYVAPCVSGAEAEDC